MISIHVSEEFAPCWGHSAAGVVARVESLSPDGDAPRRRRMSEAERQVVGMFESLLTKSFGSK